MAITFDDAIIAGRWSWLDEGSFLLFLYKFGS